MSEGKAVFDGPRWRPHAECVGVVLRWANDTYDLMLTAQQIAMRMGGLPSATEQAKSTYAEGLEVGKRLGRLMGLSEATDLLVEQHRKTLHSRAKKALIHVAELLRKRRLDLIQAPPPEAFYGIDRSVEPK